MNDVNVYIIITIYFLAGRFVCLSVCARVCVNSSAYMCLCVCVSVCACMHVCVCVAIYVCFIPNLSFDSFLVFGNTF